MKFIGITVEKRQQAIINYLFPIALFVLVIIVVSVWTIPKLISMYYEHQDIQQDRAYLGTQLVPKLDLLRSLDPVELDAQLESTREVIPESSQPTFLLSLLEDIARDVGVTVQETWYELGAQNEPDSLAVNLILTTQAAPLTNFLDKVHGTAPFILIKEMSVQSFLAGDSENDSRFLEVYLSVTSPYSPFPSILGAIDAPISLITQEEQDLLQILRSFARPVSVPSNEVVNF